MAKYILTAFADEAADDLQGQINALKRNNIGYIELRNINGKCFLDYSEEEIKEFKKMMDDAGIKVSSLGSPIGKYNITDDFEPHFERFKATIEMAKFFETKYIRMFSFFIPKGENPRNYRDEVLRRLKIMVEYALNEGIQLCHENETDIYGSQPEEVKDVLDNVPGIRGIFDPANYINDDADIDWAIENTKHNIEYIHIKDIKRDGKIMVPAGIGDGQISKILDEISSIKDDETFLTLEPHLAEFSGYGNIDNRELKHMFKFENNDESFDAAVKALKGLLNDLKFSEGEDKVWKR